MKMFKKEKKEKEKQTKKQTKMSYNLQNALIRKACSFK